MAKKDNVKVEACGISVEIDKARFADVRFTVAIGKLSDPKVPDDDKLMWYSRAMDVLFSDDAYDVMCRLADANGGTFAIDDFEGFFTEVVKAADAKN